MIRLLTGRGIAVVLISHKFDEVMRTDQVTILRRGRVVATLRASETSKEELARLMVGRSVSFGVQRTARAISPAPVLDVQKLTLDARSAEREAPRLSFQVRRGEIMGVAGVSGNGQDELFDILSGVRQPSGGTVLVDGIATKELTPPAVARLGVGYVPSDRYRDGLVGSFSIADNLLLGQQHAPGFSRHGFLDRVRVREFARDCVSRFDVATSSIDLAADRLSGGNAQKIVLAREFERATKCLLCHQPTRGLDVAIIAFVHELLLAKRAEGCAILLASEELDELINLGDRIMVMFRGEIMGIVDAQTADRETLGLMMAGQRMQ
jgi:simple sugar transport system ATP-binding protein